jgi:NADP-dependent 3-hydroxy acid dehydrogenase YdfG
MAEIFICMGYRIGAAGRRVDKLEALKEKYPESVEIERIDVCSSDMEESLLRLINKLGGMDIFLLCSGVGMQNRGLDTNVEVWTAETNGVGFVRATTAAFNYFKNISQPLKQIVVISSIAGTKGLGVAPAYSATKAMQSTYIDALAQLSNMEKYDIRFTDIRPGFIDTDLLKSGKYPMTMKCDYASKRIANAILNGKRRAVIDWKYGVLVFFWRLIPEWLWEKLSIHN